MGVTMNSFSLQKQLSIAIAGTVFFTLATANVSKAISLTNETLTSVSELDFSVDFTNCSEYAGVAPISLSSVRNLVPQPYAITGAGMGSAGLVVRTAQCDSVSVDGTQAEPGVVSQVGVSIVSPNGTGDVNTYTLWYTTDNLQLATRLQLAGVNAEFVPGLTYTDSPGQFSFLVPPPASDPFTLSGTVTEPEPNNPGFPFVANWWQLGSTGNILMQASLPNLRVGSGNLTLQTDPNSRLGALIGGGSKAFTVSLPSRFPYAGLDVTVTETPGSVPVPEPFSGLGTLTFALGAGLLGKRKRKHKPTQENESQV
jgi:hypothetical protein